jgi:hypothetical protein
VRKKKPEMFRIWNVMQVAQNGVWLNRFLLRLITKTKFGIKWEARYWREVDTDRPEKCGQTGYVFSNSFPPMRVTSDVI